MLVKIFGAVDLIAGLILIFEKNVNFPIYLLMVFGGIFLVKSFLGLPKCFASWVDFSAGVVLLLSIVISIPTIIGVIIGLLLIQKGIFSFL